MVREAAEKARREAEQKMRRISTVWSVDLAEVVTAADQLEFDPLQEKEGLRGEALTIKQHLSLEGAEALALHVCQNTRLRTLVLRNTRLGDDGMRVLADALKTNTTLTELDVSENRLGEEGAKVVADSIKNDGAMASLDVSNNNLGPEGAKHIAAAIPKCK